MYSRLPSAALARTASSSAVVGWAPVLSVVGALSREVEAIWAVTLSTGADIFTEVLKVDEHGESSRAGKLRKLGVLVNRLR